MSQIRIHNFNCPLTARTSSMYSSSNACSPAYPSLSENKSQKMSRLSKLHNIPIKLPTSRIPKKLSKEFKKKAMKISNIVKSNKYVKMLMENISRLDSRNLKPL